MANAGLRSLADLGLYFVRRDLCTRCRVPSDNAAHRLLMTALDHVRGGNVIDVADTRI